jgi:hypothetical protein
MTEETPKKKEIIFNSIDAAGNYLAEKKEDLKQSDNAVKKEAQQHPISMALPEDRKRYLMYGVSLLHNVNEHIKCAFCTLTNKAPALYSTAEVADIMRKVIVCRINGYSIKQIAHHLHSTEEMIKDVEALSLRVIKEAIDIQRAAGIPLIGVN